MERDLYVSLAKQASDLVDQGEYAKAIEIFERIAGSDLPDFDRGITWVNLATVEDCKTAYMLSWKLGCKAIALYRRYLNFNEIESYQNAANEGKRIAAVEIQTVAV